MRRSASKPYYDDNGGYYNEYIESERLILREFTENDLSALVEIASQEHILRWCADWKDCGSWVNDWFKGIKWRYSIGGS